jgi:hypothetical protein
MPSRKRNRQPASGKYQKFLSRPPRPVSTVGAGQGGLLGGPSSGGLQ